MVIRLIAPLNPIQGAIPMKITRVFSSSHRCHSHPVWRAVVATFVLAAAAVLPARADVVNGFIEWNYNLGNDSTIDLPGRLLVPTGYNGTQAYPIVVFFHGIGQRGNDNVKQVT